MIKSQLERYRFSYNFFAFCLILYLLKSSSTHADSCHVVFSCSSPVGNVSSQVSITVLATGFATDFFDSEGELGTGEGLESLQPQKVPTPKTVVGARQFAEKTYIPAGLDEKRESDGTAPTRQRISDRPPARGTEKGARQTRREEEDMGDEDEISPNTAARDSQRERDADPKRYKGIRGFFRRIFD